MKLFAKLFSDKKNQDANTPNVSTQFEIASNPIYVANDIPSFQGDYAKAVFLWAVSKPTPIKIDDEYVRYFIYECGIRRPSEYHRQMINEGYLTETSAIEELKNLKVAKLKELLISIKQPNTGKKDELIQRILDTADDSVIQKFCPERLYSISDKGIIFWRSMKII